MSPTSPTVGSSYYVVGASLPASTMVDVFATDSSGGMSSQTAMTDSTGHVTVAEVAWVSGAASAKVTDTSRHHNLLASCSYVIS